MSAVDDIAAYLAYLKTGGNRIDQIIFDEIPNGEEMTATDELRRLLDERGVECRQTEWIDGITIKWHGSDGIEYGARNDVSFDGLTGRLVLYGLTPAQAVEATLGSDLEAENEKLRELCRDMWRFTGAACKKYPRLFDPPAQGGQMVQLNAIDAFEQRMRELGVDV